MLGHPHLQTLEAAEEWWGVLLWLMWGAEPAVLGRSRGCGTYGHARGKETHTKGRGQQ